MQLKLQRKLMVKINTTDTSTWLDEQIHPIDPEDAKPQIGGGIFCLLRAIQIGFVLLLFYSSCILVKTVFFAPIIESKASPNLSLLSGEPLLSPVRRMTLRDPPSSTLLGLNNFTVLNQPESSHCAVDNLLFLVVVHSKPDHFRQRRVIRSTWGSLKDFSDTTESRPWKIRTVFVLGETSESDDFMPSGIGNSVSDLVEEESSHYKDIIRGSFIDLYHNLKYKNIFGLRYAVQHCPNAIFFLKADDDAFIDLPGLYQYLVRTFGTLNNRLKDVLGGNVFPSGTSPQREGKWAVSPSEYPWTQYPAYLGGLAYLMTPDVARDLHRVAHTNSVPEIWVDDVWVTGLLASTLNLQPLYLNPRYSYEHNEMKDWVARSKKNHQHRHPPPYTFAHLDPVQDDWESLSQDLWQMIVKSYDLEDDKTHTNDTNSPFGLSEVIR